MEPPRRSDAAHGLSNPFPTPLWQGGAGRLPAQVEGAINHLIALADKAEHPALGRPIPHRAIAQGGVLPPDRGYLKAWEDKLPKPWKGGTRDVSFNGQPPSTLQHLMASLNDDSVEATIDELAFSAGFNSLSAFYKCFRENTGLTPKAYLKQISLRART